jgi:hypothetical protein
MLQKLRFPGWSATPNLRGAKAFAIILLLNFNLIVLICPLQLIIIFMQLVLNFRFAYACYFSLLSL